MMTPHGHWRIYKDGTEQPQRDGLNYTGAGITITDDPANNRLIANIPGGSGGGHIIQDEGVSLPARSKLDFQGTGVAATDDPPNDKTVVTVPGGIASVEGVSNPGGDIDLVPANAITITSDNVAKTITFGESHSARTDNPHATTAAQVGALSSVEGVSNPGGNIDLVPGANIGITSDNVAKTITLAVNPQGAASGLDADKVDGLHVSDLDTRYSPKGHVIQDEGTSLTQRSNLNFTGAGVTVTDNPASDQTVVTIPGGGGGGIAWRVGTTWWGPVTKTNIGTTFVNIFPGLNGQRQLVDATGFAQFRIIAHWSVVGTGVQTLQCINDANPAQVLDTVDFSGAGEKERDSGWVALPAWMTGEVFLRLQGKSTVGTDDPIFRDYTILLK